MRGKFGIWLAIGTAAMLSAGEQVAHATPVPSMSVHGAPRAIAKVNVNTATIKQLRTLPGVGELLAQRIAAGRPYHELGDLLKIKGMTARRYGAIATRVTL